MASGIKVKVVLHKAKKGGYWVEVPSLAGCVSQGETRREALKNIKDATELYLEAAADLKGTGEFQRD